MHGKYQNRCERLLRLFEIWMWETAKQFFLVPLMFLCVWSIWYPDIRTMVYGVVVTLLHFYILVDRLPWLYVATRLFVSLLPQLCTVRRTHRIVNSSTGKKFVVSYVACHLDVSRWKISHELLNAWLQLLGISSNLVLCSLRSKAKNTSNTNDGKTTASWSACPEAQHVSILIVSERDERSV